jgi:hypothetical protein
MAELTFSGFVEMGGIMHARFIAPSGEPELMTHDQVKLRAARVGCDQAICALGEWPARVKPSDHHEHVVPSA